MGKLEKARATAAFIDDYTPNSASGQPKPYVNFTDPDVLYLWVNRLPELRTIPETLVSDIFGEGYTVDGGEARVKKVKKFLLKNKFQQYAKSIMRDEFITGNGYLYKASLIEDDILQAFSRFYGSHYMKKSSASLDSSILRKAAVVPDLYSPRVISPIMSRSMKINYDAHGVIHGYTQRPKNGATGASLYPHGTQPNPDDNSTFSPASIGSPADPIIYSPDEIIHFPFEPVGDQIYGTSPFAASLYDIAGLWYAKTYGTSFFQNDATPDFMYILEDESPEGENYQNIVETLKKFRNNPHKSMVFTGKVKVDRVNPMGKDLEFSNFIEKFTQRILMPWGLTPKFSHLTGKLEVTANFEGYYKRINSIQKDWEDQLNSELFEYYDVEFSFNRVYKRDESREADIVTKLVGAVWSVDEGREYLGFKPLGGEHSVLKPREKMDGAKSQEESASARSDQNEESPTGPGKMNGDEPVNNKEAV